MLYTVAQAGILNSESGQSVLTTNKIKQIQNSILLLWSNILESIFLYTPKISVNIWWKKNCNLFSTHVPATGADFNLSFWVARVWH